MSSGPEFSKRAFQRSESLHESNLIHVDEPFVIAFDVYACKVKIFKHPSLSFEAVLDLVGILLKFVRSCSENIFNICAKNAL